MSPCSTHHFCSLVVPCASLRGFAGNFHIASLLKHAWRAPPAYTISFPSPHGTPPWSSTFQQLPPHQQSITSFTAHRSCLVCWYLYLFWAPDDAWSALSCAQQETEDGIYKHLGPVGTSDAPHLSHSSLLCSLPRLACNNPCTGLTWNLTSTSLMLDDTSNAWISMQAMQYLTHCKPRQVQHEPST